MRLCNFSVGFPLPPCVGCVRALRVPLVHSKYMCKVVNHLFPKQQSCAIWPTLPFNFWPAAGE